MYDHKHLSQHKVLTKSDRKSEYYNWVKDISAPRKAWSVPYLHTEIKG